MSFQYVNIYHGPCDSFFSVIHKPQKLWGLRDKLQTLGFRVDLVPVEYINYCMVEMCGHEVFRCNINNLCFNMPPELDPVSRRAINAVVESSSKLLRARSYLWFWSLIDNQMFRRGNHLPKDYWLIEHDDNFNVKTIF